MKKSRFTEEQVAHGLRLAEGGTPVPADPSAARLRGSPSGAGGSGYFFGLGVLSYLRQYENSSSCTSKSSSETRAWIRSWASATPLL
jgi:hypothetical protein